MILDDLTSLEEESEARGIPIIGRERGLWLYELIKKIQPQHILELGTANGYSGIILGSEGASLLTIEQDPRVADEAQEHFTAFGTKAEVILGEGVEEIQHLVEDSTNHGKFDLIFIDFANKKYIDVLDHCIILVKEGGHIIADNTDLEGCREYKEAALKDNRLRTIPIRIPTGMLDSVKR